MLSTREGVSGSVWESEFDDECGSWRDERAGVEEVKIDADRLFAGSYRDVGFMRRVYSSFSAAARRRAFRARYSALWFVCVCISFWSG